MLRWGRGCGRAEKARDQHRQDADEEDAVESAGPADLGDWGAEPLNFAEIE